MKRPSTPRTIIAVSGGPDSVFLAHRYVRAGETVCLAHLNHGARGKDSDGDQRFVERLSAALGLPLNAKRVQPPRDGANFEDWGRRARRGFLQDVKKEVGADRILVGHTADDQVETILMRILEGAGISGLKGIPRVTEDGIERPLLDTWRQDIVDHLRRRGIRYRTDKSNFDTRFERNWIRHALIPLLERRYGKGVKKRIFALGDRFREIDEFLGATARRWMTRCVKADPTPGRGTVRLPRTAFGNLPAVVRKRVIQLICFEGMNIAPNERLLDAMDAVIVSGRPSARVDIGRGASLACRYGEALFRSREAKEALGAELAKSESLAVREMEGRPTPARLRRLAAGEWRAAFDADGISGPFAVRPLRAGDRIRPFGSASGKKVKEILIDRKVPRDQRWGRPAVCDGKGEIVWIPGVVRSSVAPVTRGTRRTVLLGISPPSGIPAGCSSAAPVLR